MEKTNISKFIDILKNNRVLYRTVLMHNKGKNKLVVQKPFPREQFVGIIREEMVGIQGMLEMQTNQWGLMQQFMQQWELLFKEKLITVSPQTESLKNALPETNKIAGLLDELLKLLQTELSADETQLARMLNEEELIHKRIRKIFFSMLRLVLDFLENIEKNKPLIAVVIPAHNEENVVQQAVRSAAMQSYSNKKIIVVDSASTDHVIKNLERYAIDLVRVEQLGVGLARNVGARRAIGLGATIIVFLDADSRMNNHVLDKVWESIFLEGKVAGIMKSKLDQNHWRARLVTSLHNLNRVFFKVPHTFMYCSAEICTNHAFDEDNAVGEDVAWAHKIIADFGTAKFKVIKNIWLITSSRRFEKEGYFKLLWRWSQSWPFGLLTGKKDTTYFE